MLQMRPQEVLQRRRQAHNLLRMRPRQFPEIQEHLWQSINSTFYPTTTPHRSMQPYPRQNMTRSSESSTSAKRSASESPNSINETNNFSTPRSNASSTTSTKQRGFAKWKQGITQRKLSPKKLFATNAGNFSNTLNQIFHAQNLVGCTGAKNVTNHTGLTTVIH